MKKPIKVTFKDSTQDFLEKILFSLKFEWQTSGCRFSANAAFTLVFMAFFNCSHDFLLSLIGNMKGANV